MSDEFLLECRVNQPAVLIDTPAEIHVLATIRPNPVRLGDLHSVGLTETLPAHVIVVVDVSGSMHELIRKDPHARIVSQDYSEGQPVNLVQSSVPSRLGVAQGVIRRLVERMKPTDRLSLVAFDQQAYPLLTAISAEQKHTLHQAIDQLADIGGGGTAMGMAFRAVAKALRGSQQTGTRQLVLLTDGKDQAPENALEQAREVSEVLRVPIHAFGTGECRADFLKQIAQTSGAFDYIFHEEEAEQCFDRVFRSQQNTLATRVNLMLWLSPEIQVQDLYRTKPEILYIGNIRPDRDDSFAVPIEYMERGKEYQFLFSCRVPGRKTPGTFRMARATLTYDVPALRVKDARVEAPVTLECTDDRARANVRVGDVRRVLAQAEVQRQVLTLQEKIDGLEKGGGSKEDRTTVARLLDLLIKKFTEFGDQASVNQYRGMLSEFTSKGTISQEMLNRSLASSSRPQGSGPVLLTEDF